MNELGEAVAAGIDFDGAQQVLPIVAVDVAIVHPPRLHQSGVGFLPLAGADEDHLGCLGKSCHMMFAQLADIKIEIEHRVVLPGLESLHSGNQPPVIVHLGSESDVGSPHAYDAHAGQNQCRQRIDSRHSGRFADSAQFF